MTDAQKRLRELRERKSKERQRMAELSLVDSLSDEQRSELDRIETGTPDLERQLRAGQVAVDAEGKGETRATGDPDDRELRQLIDGASVGAIFGAALEHRSTDGQTAELQQHYGLAPNQVPLAMLETRAVTPAPSDVGTNQSAIVPGVFPASCAAFLGIDTPTVPVGEAVFPVLSTNAVVGVPAEGAIPSGTGIDAEGATTGSFTADVLSPGRIQAAFFYSREDRARFAGMDEALRMNLSDALSDKLDEQILNGTEGLLNGTVLANHNVNAVTSYANYRDLFGYGRVDGTYAMSIGDIRMVVGAGTYGHMAAQFRSNNAGDRAAVEDLMDVTGGVKVSAHVPAVSNANKQNAVIRLGMRRDMVAPIWEGVTLIPDEITKASSGQIVVTAVMLHAIKLLRAGGFHKQQSQHA